MTQTEIKFDITFNKHGGVDTSKSANLIAQQFKAPLRERILAILEVAGKSGQTADELAAILGRRINSISGRCSELVDAGKICKLGIRNRGHVLVLRRYA